MKKLIIITLMLILSLSIVTAETFQLNESRRVAFDEAGNEQDIVFTGSDERYFFKTSLAFFKLDNNFSTVVTSYGSAIGQGFYAFDLNNTDLMTGGSPTKPSTMFIPTGSDVINFREINILGINDANSVNSLALNDYTPLQYEISGINGIHFDQDSDLLYVMHNDSTLVNVYAPSKPALYDISWIRSFSLIQNCGYSHAERQDITILNNQLYLLCGDKGQTPDRTVYTYSLLGDFRDTYNLNTLDNQLHSLTFTENQEELIVYDNDDHELVFFNFNENTLFGSEIVIAGGQKYNTSNLCINDNQLSTNASVSVDQYGMVILSSAEEYLTWCSNSCVNINDSNGIFQGVCTSNACFNECTTPNKETCETPNSYSLCSIGIDGCLDLSSGLFCPANTLCEDTPIGSQCVASNITEELFVQPFNSIELEFNHTNVFEVIEDEIDLGIKVATFPLNVGFVGIGQPLQTITSFFLKSAVETVLQEVKITGVNELEPSTYYALSCDFTDNVLEEDYFEVLNDFTTTNTLTNDNETHHIDLDAEAIKELESTTLSQEIFYIVKPLNTGTNKIQFIDNAYELLELQIIYNTTDNTLLIKDTAFNKLLVNETGIAGNDTLDYITFRNIFIKEADVNNIEIGVFREINDIPTQQFYYSLPIAYYSSQGTTPTHIRFYNDDSSSLRLYQIIQSEQSGFVPFDDEPLQHCEYTSLTCTQQRAWVNDRNVLTYYFHEDLQTCVNELSGVISGDPDTVSEVDDERDLLETVLGVDFSQTTKYTIGALSIIVIFGLFYYVYRETKEQLLLVVGAIVTICALFFFALVKYLPAWLLILIGAVSLWALIWGRR